MTLTEIVRSLPQPYDKEELKRKLLEDIVEAGVGNVKKGILLF
jgi:hypothetical protein